METREAMIGFINARLDDGLSLEQVIFDLAMEYFKMAEDEIQNARLVFSVAEEIDNGTLSLIEGPIMECDGCHKKFRAADLYQDIIGEDVGGYFCHKCYPNRYDSEEYKQVHKNIVNKHWASLVGPIDNLDN